MSDDQKKMGGRYIQPKGCPKCGSDMEIVNGVMEMCVNWQHPHFPEWFNKGGLRNCNHALMGG